MCQENDNTSSKVGSRVNSQNVVYIKYRAYQTMDNTTGQHNTGIHKRIRYVMIWGCSLVSCGRD
jgi:hypothetical protein